MMNSFPPALMGVSPSFIFTGTWPLMMWEPFAGQIEFLQQAGRSILLHAELVVGVHHFLMGLLSAQNNVQR